MDLSGISTAAFGDLLEMVKYTINLAIGLSALLAVIFLVKAGIDFMLSNGDSKKADSAQKTIIYSIVGLVMCFISPLIIQFILTNVVK